MNAQHAQTSRTDDLERIIPWNLYVLFAVYNSKEKNLYLIRNIASSHNTAMKTFAFMSVHTAIL